MKNLTIVAASVLGIAAAVASAAENTPPVTLENRLLRMEIHRTPAPYIGRIVHKASGQAVVAAPAFRSLFSILLVKKDGGTETVESVRAGASSVSVAQEGGSGKAAIRYQKFLGLDLAAEVRILWEEAQPLTRWWIRIENHTGRRIRAVRFPQLLAVPAIGDGKDDCLVLPALPGVLIENPAQNWGNGQSVVLAYPGILSAQFLAYQDRAAGLYLAGMDAAGYPMSWTVYKQAEGLRFWHEYPAVADEPDAGAATRAGEGATRWQSPYPVAIGVTQGTWHDSADQYKQWAIRQPWCAKRLSERDDIPAWWKEGPAVHVVEVHTYDGKRTSTGSYYPKLAEHLRTLRTKIDGPVVAMLAGWENHRRWTAGDYFPVFDADHARQVIGQLKQDGFRPFFFLSGLFFTYRNEGRDGGEIPAAEKHSAAYVLEEKTGKPKPYVLNESNAAGDWKRHSYQFCVSPPATREFFCEVIDQAHTLGVDVLQMDQTVSGGGEACYASGHGHVPGAGRYQSRAFWELLAALRAHGKSRSADFVLFHEEPHEQLIPYLDGFHVREYYEKRWYRAYPGAVGIPLFSYLYHEYAIGYGGDSAGLSKHADPWLVRNHAMNLVAGRTPGVSIWSSHSAVAEAHPDQIAMLRSHCRLLKTRANECLMLGRMLHPYELVVPKLALGIPVQKGAKWEKQEVPTPAILTSSWQSPAGRIGHLFVNLAPDSQRLAIRLDAPNVPTGQSCGVDIWRSSGSGEFEPWGNDGPLPKPFATQLQPLEVVFVELRMRP